MVEEIPPVMKNKRILPIAACALLALTTADGLGQVEWTFHKTADGAHPDGNEQEMMWLMNRARANPTEEGMWLASGAGSAEVNSAINFFNVDTEVLQNEFEAIEAKPPAAFDVRLYNAAKAHSEDLIARDAQDHNGQNDKVTQYGFVRNGARYSVFSFSRNPVYAHAALNIDWGNGTPDGMQVGRGHRAAIMSIGGNYTNVGIAMVPESNPATEVGPLVFSGNYAQASNNAADHYNRFLVGTVWDDTNENGKYDAGEGLAGVEVRPEGADYFAVTGDAGGFSIPMDSGTYSVAVTGSAIGGRQTHSVSVGEVSVLLDIQDEPTEAEVVFGDIDYYGNNILYSRWLGYMFDSYYPWIAHAEHGWLYCVGEFPVVFIYDLGQDAWLYSTEGVYPFMYNFSLGLWQYFLGKNESGRVFVNFLEGGGTETITIP